MDCLCATRRGFVFIHKGMDVSSISFRYKDVFGLAQDRIPLSQPGSCDNYLLAFLCGLDYTDTYTIDVANPNDALCALMVVLAIDAEKCSRDNH